MKREVILIMFMIYIFVLALDVNLTMNDPGMESSIMESYGYHVTGGWIALTGIPLNLFLQYLVIAIPLFYWKTWDKIDTKIPMFLFFYIYILVMIVGHVAGIMSWVC